MRDYKKVIYLNLLIGGGEYKTWNRGKTKWLLTVFEGGYCLDCGCISNYKLNYDYVPGFYKMDIDVGYRVIGFVCRDCGCEYKIRIY